MSIEILVIMFILLWAAAYYLICSCQRHVVCGLELDGILPDRKYQLMISPLHYRVLPTVARGRRLIELTRPLVVRVKTPTFRLVVQAPKGTQSDLASVPRALWWLFPPDGVYQEAAVIHDYLYAEGAPRWLADALFRYIMIETGVPPWKYWLMWVGVRCGGWVWHGGKQNENTKTSV